MTSERFCLCELQLFFSLVLVAKIIQNFCRCSDIVSAMMSTKPITFSRSQAGWIWRADRTVSI